jgi:hypothetical protein
LVALERPAAEFRQDGRLSCRGRNFPHRDAAELDQIAILQIALLAGADHNETRYVKPCGGDDLKRRSRFSRETIRSGGAAEKLASRRQRLLCRGTEFEALRAEHNKNSAQTIV